MILCLDPNAYTKEMAVFSNLSTVTELLGKQMGQFSSHLIHSRLVSRPEFPQ